MMKPSTFAGQMAGPNVEVLCLVPLGGDFHAAKPSPSAATSVVHSDLVFPLGLGSAGWVKKPFLANCVCPKPAHSSREAEDDFHAN